MAPCTARLAATSTSGRSSVVSWRPRARQERAVSARAAPERTDDPLQEDCPVPVPQRPVSELKQLQQDFIFSLAERPLPDFLARIAAVYAGAGRSRYLPCTLLNRAHATGAAFTAFAAHTVTSCG